MTLMESRSLGDGDWVGLWLTGTAINSIVNYKASKKVEKAKSSKSY